ncbi:uncharacterized protein N7496_005027 [Penicillium cataractarum]|uniref:Inheritance of peroxisomes protein 1 n=1 Tax=Penicillium cataractarum TaxID=2100454 RepID=A0A9W9VD15_9EURO|nr:uncharacterized protein N7496_005027 [Penicillium cataractarum]KAJ5377618.1 hypothetical protein N7496_005027 [Penicillium cataractarum]
MPGPLKESSGPVQSIRRTVTLPTKLNPQAQRGSAAPNLSENVIFYHPSAKIVHFAPRALVPIPSSSAPSDFDYPVDTIETLPWRSATERTVATAPLRLERGLTVFLKCGNVVHAILKNSQCWCVDGVSKFVLRIRPLTYYRIELPHETAEDMALVEDLKTALPTVLRYEVTPCPFKRAFTVDLPEEATAPRRKKAWRPKERRDGVPLLSATNQGFLCDGKTDWLDSASTGDDTDGAATDDSGLTPQRTRSTTSEAVPGGDESPVFTNDYGTTLNPAPARRSVTETPQTFTSLRAKFDATPVLEESSVSDEPETKEEARKLDEPVPAREPVVQETSKTDESPSLEDPIEPAVASAVGDALKSPDTSSPEETAELPATLREETSSADDLQCRSVLPTAVEATVGEDVSSAVHITRSDETEDEPGPKAIQESEDAPVQAETPASAETDAPEQILIPQDLVSESCSLPDEDSGSEADHDSSFSSTPESFHSVDLPSLQRVSSSHINYTETHDDALKPGTSVAASVAELSAKQASIAVSSENNLSSGMDVAKARCSPKQAESNAPQPELKMPKYIVREDPPKKPSLGIPSGKKLAVTSATSPVTDFQHMSTEFRRRAQATRRRDVSPMPPSSTIYQPPPNDHASSLLTKALSLVLVPPIHLFIILLHVAARIVISPALNSTLGDSSSGSQSSNKKPLTEDDFSFPLEREASSEYEDAEMSRKLDPWDLD